MTSPKLVEIQPQVFAVEIDGTRIGTVARKRFGWLPHHEIGKGVGYEEDLGIVRTKEEAVARLVFLWERWTKIVEQTSQKTGRAKS